MSSFKELGLPAPLLEAITASGFTKPTPVQAESIGPGLKGRDLLVSSQTGSGKTIAFLMPMIAQMLQNRDLRALVIVPTRELAIQVNAVVVSLQPHLVGSGISSVVLVGGLPMYTQTRDLGRKPRIVIATPGRLLDHARKRAVMLPQTSFFVVDEADRLFDMGFLPQLKEVLRFLPRERQTLLFSATFPNEIKALAREILKDPVEIKIQSKDTPPPEIHQELVEIETAKKNDAILDALKNHQGSHLIFARTQVRADKLTRYLTEYGVKVAAIHGGRSQSQRNRSLNDFRSGVVRVLVATDIASRGIDVPHVAHVLNYDLPMNPEDYIHRIGRTGRAGRKGHSVTFVTEHDHDAWATIVRKTGIPLPGRLRRGDSRGGHSRPPVGGQMGPGRRESRGYGATRPARGGGGRPHASGGRPQTGGGRPHASGGRPQSGRAHSTSDSRPARGNDDRRSRTQGESTSPRDRFVRREENESPLRSRFARRDSESAPRRDDSVPREGLARRPRSSGGPQRGGPSRGSHAPRGRQQPR